MGFKMKGHTLPGINQKMDKSSASDGRAKSSAFQRLDVLIDGKNVGTGDEAYAKGRVAEEKKKDAWDVGTAGTEKERQSKEAKETQKTRQTKISYTKDDAHKRIKDSKLSPKEKRNAHAKVRGGGSYDA
jgi:hypothetical protein